MPSLLAMGSRSAIQMVLPPAPQTNLRVETICGAGHFLPEEAPGEVLTLAEDWFAHEQHEGDDAVYRFRGR